MKFLKAPSLPLGKIVILTFLWCYLTFTARSQSIYEQIGRLPVTDYTSDDYGSYPYLNGVIQSEEGLMYFGNDRNLFEYDGASWRSLFERNELTAIGSFAKDAKGRIFYAGLDFGYFDRDPKGETRLVSLLNLIPEELRINKTIFSICFLNEFILLQTRTHTLRLELSENFTLKSFKSWSTDTRFARGLMLKNEYYVRQNDKGLFRLEGDDLKLVPGTEFFGKEPLAVLLPFPGKGEKTILLGGQLTGFFLLDGSSLSKFPTEVDQLIKAGALLQEGLQHEGNIILGFLGGGVVIMNPKGEIIQRINTDNGLPSDGINGLYLDQAGGLWVMTEDGIARVAIDSPILSFGKESGINSEVKAIQKIGNTMYLGTSSGLVKFNSDSRSFQSLPGNNTGLVINLVADGDDLIVPGQQLQVVRGSKTITLNGPDDGSRPVYAFIPKQHPNLLLVGSNQGLLEYRRGLSKDFPWEYKGKIPGVDKSNGYIYIFEENDGTIFYLVTGKIYALNVTKEELASDSQSVIITKTFEADAVNDRFSAVNGEFFLRSGAQMQKYSSKERKFVPTEEFSEVQQDLDDFNQIKSGIFWYESRDKKKYILKRNSEGKFVKDEKPNSLAPFLSIADYLDEDSIFWFGSPKGLIRYNPKKDHQSEKEFFTLIRRIETKTDTLPLIAYGRDKTLPAREMKDNSYRFEFAAPYFEEEKKTRYQTFLEGFDQKWVDWNDNKFKEYTNLPAGSYTFRVRAMAHTGRISEEAVFSFVVLPPWYATWWAYLIYALLIGGLITIIVKWRSRKLKAENRILEERVNERTAELEKSLTDLKATQAQLIQSEKMASLGELTAGIAHEIQNPLNFVNNFSEVNQELLLEMNEEIEKGNLDEVKLLVKDLIDNEQKINHHGKRADAIVKGMLQHSRTSSGQKEPTDINALADEYLRLAYHGLRAKDKTFNADFKTEFDPNLPKINVVPQDIGRVILNLITNAFYAVNEKKKQNLENYEATVTVSTKIDKNNLIISVADNGNGIPHSVMDKIFQPFFTTKPTGEGTGLGLSMSYEIITKAHGGELKVENNTNGGAEFVIFLPV